MIDVTPGRGWSPDCATMPDQEICFPWGVPSDLLLVAPPAPSCSSSLLLPISLEISREAATTCALSIPPASPSSFLLPSFHFFFLIPSIFPVLLAVRSWSCTRFYTNPTLPPPKGHAAVGPVNSALRILILSRFSVGFLLRLAKQACGQLDSTLLHCH